nr:hypothetical protein BaRGS_023020 [Batillaria attramentaria]
MWTWLMFGVVLASLYSSKLTSSLTVSDQALPFTSLSQLVNQDTYTWGVAPGTATEALLKNSNISDYKKFYEGFLKFGREDPSVFSRDNEVHKRKVLTENYAHFAISSDPQTWWQADSCHLAFIPESFLTSEDVLYLQKGSPYTDLISQK